MRWIDNADIYHGISSLQGELEEMASTEQVTDSIPPKADDTPKLVFGLVALVLLALLALVVLLAVFGKRDPEHQLTLRSYAVLGLIFVGLPLGTYIWAKFFYGVRAQKLKDRDQAFRQLAEKYETLQFGGFTKITGDSVGRVPWLATELDVVVECDAHGSCQGLPLAVLECTFVVDMTLSNLEATVGKLGATVMSHVQHEHVRRRMMEAYVFFEPINNLPDIYWAKQKQALNWYFKKYVGGVEPVRRKPDWLMTSDENQCLQALSPKVQELFAAKPDCVVQVLGGYVSLIPQTWDWNRPVDMPCQFAEIDANLRWACDLYKALRSTSTDTHANPAVQALPNVARRPPKVDVAPTPERSAAEEYHTPLERKSRSWVQILMALAGVGATGIGLLIFAAMLSMSIKAKGTPQWPTVTGRMVVSEAEQKGTRFYPKLDYVYEVNGTTLHGDKLALGPAESEKERTKMEAMLAKYPANAEVKVFYNAQRPAEAILEPRLALEGMNTCSMVGGGIMGLMGLFLMFLGLRRK